MCTNACGWCGLGLYCTLDGDAADDELVYCIPKDIFVDGDEGCTSFIDESEILLLNNEGRDTFTI